MNKIRSRSRLPYLLLLLAVPLALLPGKAGAGDEVHWTPLGPGGGGNSVTWGVSPVDPNIVLAGSDVGGIFRSTDGGLTWLPRNQARLRPDHSAAYHAGDAGAAHGHFTFNPPTGDGDPNVVYLGVQKSTDAGNTWSVNVDDNTITAGGTTVDPYTSSIVYAYGYGNIYRSTDAFSGTSCEGDGAGVTDCGEPPKACRRGMKCYQRSCLPNTSSSSSAGCTNDNMAIHGLVVNPTNTNELLACTDVGLFKSGDNAKSWSREPNNGSGLPTGLPGLCVGGTKPGSTCTNTSPCLGGGSCVASVCGGSNAVCSSDAECRPNPGDTQTCQNIVNGIGRCGGSGSQCWLTSDCSQGQVCKTLSCTSMTINNPTHTIYITLKTRPTISGAAEGGLGWDPWIDVDTWQGGVYKSDDFGLSWSEANGLNDGLDYLADKNPGFEQPLGTPDPNFAWVIPSTDTSYVSRVCSPEPAHTGNCSIKITHPLCSGGPNNGNPCSSDTNCLPGGTCPIVHMVRTPEPGDSIFPSSSLLHITGGSLYKLRAWYKVTEGTTFTSYTKVHWYKADRNPLTFPGKTWHNVETWVQDFPATSPRTYDWQKFETLIRAPDAAYYAAIDFRGGVGTIWIDDVSFQVTEDPVQGGALPRITGRGESPSFASYTDVVVPPTDNTGNVAYVGTLRATTAGLEGTDTGGIWKTVDGGNHWTLTTRASWHDNVIDESRYEPVCGDGVCGGRWETCSTCPGDCNRNVCSGGSNNGVLCASGSECPSGTCVAPSFCCGDFNCDTQSGENRTNCPVDCYETGDHDPIRVGQNENCTALYGGSTWYARGCNIAHGSTWSLAIGLTPGGTIPGNLVIYSAHQHLKSTDGGDTWRDMTSTPYTSPPSEEPGAGTFQGRGDNGVFTFFAVKDSRGGVNRLYNGDTDNLLMVSYNNGTSFTSEGWQWSGDYRAPQDPASPLLRGDAATSIALDSDPNKIYVGVATGAGSIQQDNSFQSGVVKGMYNPKSGSVPGHWDWSRMGTFAGVADGGGGIDLVEHGIGYLFAAFYSHGVFKLPVTAGPLTPWTSLSGSNWGGHIPANWKIYRIKQDITGRLYVGAGDPQYGAGTIVPSDETGVWESNDSGANWCRISIHGTGLDDDMDKEAVLDLVPLGVDSLLVATSIPLPGSADGAGNYRGDGGIYKGIRVGNCNWTWTRVLRQPRVSGLAVSPTDRSIVYAFAGQGTGGGPYVIAGQKAGIYRSDDEGVTWHSVVNDGLGNLSQGALNMSDTDPNTLYASTLGTGSFVGTRTCTNPIAEDLTAPATCFDGLDNDCDGVTDYDCSLDTTNQSLSSGTIQSGASTDLKGRPDGDVSETIREGPGSSKPLDVIWTFSGIPTGKVYYLNVEGFKASGNDTFTFKSTTKLSGTCNGSETNYTTRLTLTPPRDTDVPLTASLGTVTSSSPVVCIRVQDSGTKNDGVQDVISLDRVYLFTAPPEVTASSDYQTVIGLITAGSYLSTVTSDDVRESIRELQDATVSPQVSRLEHIWKFDGVPFGSSHQLNLEGIRVQGQDIPVDNFQFSYSTDGLNFSDINSALINSDVPEITGGGYFPFGPVDIGGTTYKIGGTIYIRVKDTNTNSGTNLDTVKIDRIAIKTIP